MTDKALETDYFETEAPKTDELPTTNHLRARIARALEASQSQDTLAGALTRLRHAEGSTPLQLAVLLGTDIAGLDRLALCRPPRDQAFIEDTNRIADYCGCKPGVLLTILRRVQVLSTFADAAASELKSVTYVANNSIPAQRPWMEVLVAARDADVENKAEGDISDTAGTSADVYQSTEGDNSDAKSK